MTAKCMPLTAILMLQIVATQLWPMPITWIIYTMDTCIMRIWIMLMNM